MNKALTRLAAIFVMILVAFVFLNGLSDTLSFAIHMLLNPAAKAGDAGRFYTQGDPELGWVGKPNASLPNAFGPGRGVKLDSRGFRDDAELAPEVPPGKLRVVCSGDSFAFGTGVGNDDTWCHILTKLNPSLETANLGQGGYGIDQAFLRYRREAPKLPHQVHLFSFIYDDFRRVQSDTTASGALHKPYLDLEGSRVVVRGVPIAQHSYLVHRMWQYMDDLGLVRMFASGGSRPRMNDAKMLEVVLATFEEMRQMAAAQHARFIPLYLVSKSDCIPTDPWALAAPLFRKNLMEQLKARGFEVIDTTEEFCRLPLDEKKSLFINSGPGFNHYNEKGNDVVARIIYKALEGMNALGRQ